MASRLSWLLRLTAFCYLIVLLAGQHHGVNKCITLCKNMTPKIPMERLISYQRNQASCDKPAIILKTIKNRTFCADPAEEWVQKTMKYLDEKAAALVQNGGTFEKIVGEPRTTPAARGTDRSAGSEPKAPGESNSQQAPRALGTSPELPTGVAGSWGTGSPAAPKALDGGPLAGPERTEIFSTTFATSATSWQSSSAYQPGSDLWTEGKASEAPSTQAPPTQAPPTQTPSTHALPTQTPSTQASSNQTPSTQAPPTQAPSTQALPTQAPSTQTAFTQALSTQPPPTQAPSISHIAPADSVGSEGQSVRIDGQDPTPEDSLASKEKGSISVRTGAFTGPGSVPHVSVAPFSSEGAPSREPATSSSGDPKTKEPTHATVSHQRHGLPNTPPPDSGAATRRQAVGLLAFLGLLFGLGVAMFAYQSLQGCPRNMAGDMVEGLRHVPRSCGSNSYVLVPV
ncbi:fractalkine [Pteronotus mesoamericanus]|uniref:fractalkine n=1 Tax=Pteronotus mesoamericanus TaxID=1884717 RepID=UPI0023EB39FA|nr:fractalkine [Pteronotus parnellii mesoamericanus]